MHWDACPDIFTCSVITYLFCVAFTELYFKRLVQHSVTVMANQGGNQNQSLLGQAIFPALAVSYMFSRAWRLLHVFRRSTPVTCFPALAAGYTFAVLDAGFLFSRACCQLHFCIEFWLLCYWVYSHYILNDPVMILVWLDFSMIILTTSCDIQPTLTCIIMSRLGVYNSSILHRINVSTNKNNSVMLKNYSTITKSLSIWFEIKLNCLCH